MRDGSIVCRPGITSIEGRTVTFTDGSTQAVKVIICATGYDVEIPYLSESVWTVLGSDLALYRRTLHPDIPGFGVVGQFLALGPYFPLLELQARWIAAVWSGEVPPPGEAMRRVIAGRGRCSRPQRACPHAGRGARGRPRPADGPTSRALVFGPLLPPRYRLSGPGASPRASALFTQQLAASPRAPIDPADIDALRGFGWTSTAAMISGSMTVTAVRAGPRGSGR